MFPADVRPFAAQPPTGTRSGVSSPSLNYPDQSVNAVSIASFSVRNQVLVNMMMFVILVAGTIFAFTLVREMFPESRPDKLTIMAVYPGVQPQEVEKALTIKIEEAVRDIRFVDKVDSTVNEGMSLTVLTLTNSVKDVDVTLQEVKNEIDALQDIPDDVEKITVNKAEPQLPVISVAIYGDGEEAGLKRAARELRDELLTLPGISSVQVTGGRDDEIHIEVDPDRLLEFNVTFDEIANIVRDTNLDVSGGELKGDRTSISVRTLGEESTGRELEDIVVRTQPDGRQVRLSDVATIRDHFIESDMESYFNSKPAMNCVVYKNATQDAIQISTLVKAYVLGKKGEPFDPYGMDAAYSRPWYSKPFALASAYAVRTLDQLTGRPDPMVYYRQSLTQPFNHSFEVDLNTDLARFVEGRLDLMTRNGKAGLLLVLISLNLFLNWRVAFWAAVGLLVSFLGTFAFMWAVGASINLLSMFGLIIVLGIIVDDAIVIGENIYRHVEEGLPPIKAAVVGTNEVMWPVIIAVTTTIGAFAPLFFIPGQIGDFMRQLPLVVVAALSVSLLEALVILPAHLAHMPSPQQAARSRSPYRRRIGRWMEGFRDAQDQFMNGFLTRNYERFLRRALTWRYVTLAVAIATVILSFGLVAGGVVEQTFIQDMDSETLICLLEMPVGTTTENVKLRLKKLSDYVIAMPETLNVQTFAGLQYDMEGAGATGVHMNSHLGQLIIELKPADEREQNELRSSDQILEDLRSFSLRELQGINSVAWEAMNGGPGGKDIHIQVSGPDFEAVQQTSAWLSDELESFAGVYDLDNNFDRGKREVQLRLRESARPTGLTVGQLGYQVRSAMYGRESKRLTRNREDVRLMVRYPERFREDIQALENMWIPVGPTPETRHWVPIREVAELSESQSFASINRSRQQRSITVYGEINEELAGVTTREVLDEVKQRYDSSDLPTRYPGIHIRFLGQIEEQMKSFEALWVAFPVALLLIYSMLAGLFRSYLQPLVVMAAIPFGLEGAIIGHWITDNPITILSRIGFVALAGILVNDSLVLVDFINKRVRQGMSEFEASVDGAKLRLRAILLTTLTTVAGLTPLMFETSFQAKFLIPMAVTLTFGLLFATVLTLLIVPTLNLIFFDLRNLWRGWIYGDAAGTQRQIAGGSVPATASAPSESAVQQADLSGD